MTTGGRRLGLVIALAVAIIAALVSAGLFDGDGRGERPAPAGKVMSPPAVEPLPAPRARGQLGTPAHTPPTQQ
ncbi:MAG TPA: hypothetical protein VFU21_25100 [Kofleriaceae bacterium]|nr:hypothetical protein [Kofleriaceae bacterium]